MKTEHAVEFAKQESKWHKLRDETKEIESPLLRWIGRLNDWLMDEYRRTLEDLDD